MKYYITILFFIPVILFSQCDTKKKKDIIRCKNITEKTAKYIYQFQMTDDSLYLDSALTYTNKALKKCNEDKDKILFSFRKIDILSKKHDYLSAIRFIKSVNYSFVSDLPYYNDFLSNRFQAMEYHYKKKYIKRDSCLMIINKTLENFMKQNKEKIDSLVALKNINEILNNSLHLTYIQYFYTRSVLFGYKKTKSELDSCQKKINGNKKFYELIDYQCKENDFLDFNLF